MKALMCFILLAGLGFSMEGRSQDLVYRPVNPAFGGDTFNYQWMLSSAQAQNKFDDVSRSLLRNPLDDFEANLNRQILNQLSRELINQIFGESKIQDGTFQFGSLSITVASGLEGINITIYNSQDGSQTSITVPYY